MKEKGMSIEQVVNAVEIAIHKLPHMENLYGQVTDQLDKMQRTRQGLVNDIGVLELKISILDKIAFSSELDCKRTEQRVQEFYAQKDRLKKLIANILDGEDYSKVKQVAKENVKAVLADNKILISVSFGALIQTLKADPQMIKLIQNIPSANDGEQDKDDNNNIIKYLEFNKDSILYLTEKNYENLVETLTNNVIGTTADTSFSSNLVTSLPLSSSSTFSRPSDQSDTTE
jgi:hypothetical protein